MSGQTFSPCGDTPGAGDPVFDIGTIFNPLAPTTSHICNTATQDQVIVRQEFKYNGQLNVIPPTLINATGLNIANLYPLPNGAGLFNNYFSNQNRVNDESWLHSGSPNAAVLV